MDLMREKLRSRGHHRAHIGGGSSSETSSSSTTNQTDNRRTIGAGGISAEGSTVNVLDGGAIANAFDFSKTAIAQAFDFGTKNTSKAISFGSDALDFATKSNQQALDSLNTESQLVAAAYNDAKGRGALTDKILIGAIAMAGLVAVMALKK